MRNINNLKSAANAVRIILGAAGIGIVSLIAKNEANKRGNMAINAKISDIDRQINDKSSMLGKIFNKSELSNLHSQRNDLVNKRHF